VIAEDFESYQAFQCNGKKDEWREVLKEINALDPNVMYFDGNR